VIARARGSSERFNTGLLKDIEDEMRKTPSVRLRTGGQLLPDARLNTTAGE
jgi:hypothetical protein